MEPGKVRRNDKDIVQCAAFKACKELSRTEGYLVGISSGAALYAAANLAKEEKYIGKRIVVLLPDTGERYLSTGIFD